MTAETLPVVAWDWFNRRQYGAPGETQHRFLVVESYRLPDGSTPDLDWLLESHRADAATIHLEPLVKQADALSALTQATKERDRLWAARIGYASQFAPDAHGLPDVGSVHANIRALKAERDELRAALKIAEAALADIGDADREPGDDLAWCEARAAEALPTCRAALSKTTQEPTA